MRALKFCRQFAAERSGSPCPWRWGIEYESVALRPGLVPALTAEEIQVVVDVLCKMARPQKIFYTWRPFLPDPDDDLVIELAAAAGCAFIVTHNIKDFKGSESLGIRAITPAQALNLI